MAKEVWEQPSKWFDYFAILGVSENTTPDEIRKAYLDLAKKYHPDMNPNNKNYEEFFKKINIAYETLTDSEKRKKYIEFSNNLRKTNQDQRQNAEQKQHTQRQNNTTGQDKTVTFKDLVSSFKEKENQIKVHINQMIKTVEEKETRFSNVYKEFCKSIMDGTLKSNDFEVRRQKLRTVELSCVNAIQEIEKIMDDDLDSIDLELERKKIKKILKELKKTEPVLMGNYQEAKIILNTPKIFNFFKQNRRGIALIGGVLTVCLTLYACLDFFKEINSFENIEDDKQKQELTIDTAKFEQQIQNLQYQQLNAKIDYQISTQDWIIFKDFPEDGIFDTMSEPYTYGHCEIREATKDGVRYLLDAKDNHILVGNVTSMGFFNLYEEGYEVCCILASDGYDYYLDAYNLQNVIKIKKVSHKGLEKVPKLSWSLFENFPNTNEFDSKSEPYSLFQYKVVDATKDGKNYLLDANNDNILFGNYNYIEPIIADNEKQTISVIGIDGYEYTLDANDLNTVLQVRQLISEDTLKLVKQKG